jgi:hypothetical protein
MIVVAAFMIINIFYVRDFKRYLSNDMTPIISLTGLFDTTINMFTIKFSIITLFVLIFKNAIISTTDTIISDPDMAIVATINIIIGTIFSLIYIYIIIINHIFKTQLNNTSQLLVIYCAFINIGLITVISINIVYLLIISINTILSNSVMSIEIITNISIILQIVIFCIWFKLAYSILLKFYDANIDTILANIDTILSELIKKMCFVLIQFTTMSYATKIIYEFVIDVTAATRIILIIFTVIYSAIKIIE